MKTACKCGIENSFSFPFPTLGLQLTVNIPAHNHRKKYQNMKVTLTAYPSPAL